MFINSRCNDYTVNLNRVDYLHIEEHPELDADERFVLTAIYPDGEEIWLAIAPDEKTITRIRRQMLNDAAPVHVYVDGGYIEDPNM